MASLALMDSLLLDLSGTVARAEVVEVSGKTIKVRESSVLEIPALREYLFEKKREESPSVEATPPSEGNEAAPAAPDLKTSAIAALQQFLSSVGGALQRSIVIAPTTQYLSLSLDLPFSEPRQLSKIVPLEVQDRVPFDIGDRHLAHKSVGALPPSEDSPEGGFDIHVSATIRDEVKALLEVLNGAGLEPVVLTTRASLLGALYFLGKDYFAQDAAFVDFTGEDVSVAMGINSTLRSDRLIRRKGVLAAHEEDESTAQKLLVTEIKLTLASFEDRHQIRLSAVYFLGDDATRRTLAQALGRPVEEINLSQLVANDSKPPSLLTLGGVFALEDDAPEPLSNFRSQQFAYNPKLKELLRGGKRLLPYVGALLVGTIVFLTALYGVRAFYISAANDSIAQQIRTSLTGLEFPIPEGAEVKALQGQVDLLRNQLRDLGSLSQISPLDSLLEITKHFPQQNGVELRSVIIKGGKIKLEGSAPDYASVERITKELSSKKDVFHRVKEDTSPSLSSGGSGRGFTIEIILPE